MPAPPSRPDRPNGPLRPLQSAAYLPLLGGLSVAALLVLVAATLWSSREQELEKVRVTTLNLSAVLREQTARTLQNVDAAMLQVGETLRNHSRTPETMRAELRETLLERPFLRAIWVLDARGQVIYDSDDETPPERNCADRRYFRWHVDGPGGLFIGKPIESRLDGDWFLPLSRGVKDGRGRLLGVVVAAVEPDYFERFYDTLSIGSHGAITIRHGEGELIARIPHRDDLIGQPPPFAVQIPEITRTVRVTSAVDGVERIYTSRPVEAMPLVVTVGISVDEALEDWCRSAAAFIAGTLVVALLLIALTWLLGREIRGRERLTESLRREESLLRQVVESLPVAVFVADRAGRIFLTNSATQRIWGADEALKTGDYSRFRGRWTRTGIALEPDDWAMARALSRGESSSNEMIDIETLDGQRKTILNWAAPIRDANGEVIGGVAINEDITRERALAESLGEIEARFEAMFEYSIEATLITAPDGRVLAANREACRLLGYSREALLEQNIGDILAQDDSRTAALFTERERIGHARGETIILRSDGSRFPGEIASALYRDPRGEIKASVTLRDITRRKQAEERIAYLAFNDELTGLPNRAAFGRSLAHAIARSERHRSQFALLMVDLDGFKNVNDRYGHEAGDRVLVQVARRLRANVREADTVARLGGDEFVLMLEQPGGETEVRNVARKVLAATSAEIAVGNQHVSVTASVGIALYPRHGSDIDTLMRNVDAAMYRAKEKGRNRAQLYGET